MYVLLRQAFAGGFRRILTAKFLSRGPPSHRTILPWEKREQERRVCCWRRQGTPRKNHSGDQATIEGKWGRPGLQRLMDSGSTRVVQLRSPDPYSTSSGLGPLATGERLRFHRYTESPLKVCPQAKPLPVPACSPRGGSKDNATASSTPSETMGRQPTENQGSKCGKSPNFTMSTAERGSSQRLCPRVSARGTALPGMGGGGD